MRVLVSCDRIGRLGSAEASDVIAEAFAERGAQVAVTPLAEGGDGFAGAVQRFSPGARVLAARSFQQVCELLGESPGYLDATAVAARNTARPVRTHPGPGTVTVHERLPPTIQSITPPVAP